jgi:ureidoglycolate lyase
MTVATVQIETAPLTAAAFEPFGEVMETPPEFQRVYFERALANGRTAAHPSFSMWRIKPLLARELVMRQMERHAFSSQTFLPLDAARYLVIVAPAGREPDPARLQAFVARGDQAITYRMGTWHHGLTVLDRPASFAVFMWRDGTAADEEFFDIVPTLVHFP